MKTLKFLSLFILLAVSNQFNGQQLIKSGDTKKFYSLKAALQKPEKVYWLNISREIDTYSLKELAKFPNLEYLSLRNARLKTLPIEIGTLKSLKILDLGGNNFEFLPFQIAGLNALEEIYLDKDIHLNLNQAFNVLSKSIAFR